MAFLELQQSLTDRLLLTLFELLSHGRVGV